MALHCSWVFLLLSVSALCCSAGEQRSSPGLLYYHDVMRETQNSGYTVTYDDRSFFVNKKRTLFLSGSVHYPRSTPADWDTIFEMMVEDGLNMVEVYLFWNLHEFKQGQPYNFSGSANWTLFVEKAAKANLFVNLRIGPYVCAEWNYGGLPVWLNTIPGMKLRSSSGPWEQEMARFVKDMAKIATPYLAKNSGPIVLAQIENEYHEDDPDYIKFCGLLAASLDLGIPWVMCNGESATGTINTCNGNDCTSYAENHGKAFPGQPLAWTENEGWFQEWDKEPMLPSYDDRTPEDMAFVIAKWFARGGCHHNYYMWFGGNHFARWAGSSVTSKYADGVNVHCDGQPNEPKKTHLKKLHKLLAEFGDVLLYSPSQISHPQRVLVLDTKSKKFVNATKQYAYVYQSGNRGLVFVENIAESSVLVMFNNTNFTLPALSSSLVDFSSNKELYNTGKVDSSGLPTKWVFTPVITKLSWRAWPEDVSTLDKAFSYSEPLEQLLVTKDETDYLFYQTTIKAEEAGNITLTVQSNTSNAFLAFIDGKIMDNTYDSTHKYGDYTATLTLSLSDIDSHQLTLLSTSLGLANYFSADQGLVVKGITGAVTLGSTDITKNTWLHRPKLEGEILELYTNDGSSHVTWNSFWEQYVGQPLVWFQTDFPNPNRDNPILISMQGMGRGHVYVNGIDIGRFWLVEVNGKTVQQYYHIPRDWLQEDNSLTIVEELGATDPSSVSIGYSSVVVP